MHPTRKKNYSHNIYEKVSGLKMHQITNASGHKLYPIKNRIFTKILWKSVNNSETIFEA